MDALRSSTPANTICRCLLVSTVKSGMLVSMRLSEKYAVPPELALLYDFVNTLDRRRYIENGVAHTGGDELETPRNLELWLRKHGLLQRGEHVPNSDHRAAVELRAAIRAFLRAEPQQRECNKAAACQLTAASRRFPLML